MSASHVVVWLDHSEAHIIAFGRETSEAPVIIHSGHKHEHQHHRADSVGSGRAAEHPEYYDHIVQKIRDNREWLIVGPASAKLALIKHVTKRHHALLDHVIGVETVDHPSDGQLLAYARKYFVAADRLLA
jgi:hypothetical protein